MVQALRISQRHICTLILLNSLLLLACSQIIENEHETSNSILDVPYETCDNETYDISFEGIINALGYAFSPTNLPEHFIIKGISLDNRRRANLIYESSNATIVIAYPVNFDPLGSPTMRELGLTNPEDAVTSINLHESEAYLLKGGWSTDTIMAGPGIDPSDAVWDYKRSLSLYFDCSFNESPLTLVIQARFKDVAQEEPILIEEHLIRIAKSIARVQKP